jgi:predicted Zn-dependent protease
MSLRTAAGTSSFVIVALTASVTAISLVSVEQEIALGREAQRQVRGQVLELTDRQTREYVRSVGRRLAARAGGPKYPYSFSVANYRELNAFALPGGPVWIHRGIIHAAATEAQLAGVVAHEVAHIAQRHAADQISKRLVANGALGLLGALLGNGSGARAAQIGAAVLAGGYMLKFSRDDELEADRVGTHIMRRAGWDPRGMAEFVETLRRQQGRNPGSVEVFLSSHPAPAERVSALRKLPGTRAAGRRDSPEFQRVKRRVAALPPARSMPKR